MPATNEDPPALVIPRATDFEVVEPRIPTPDPKKSPAPSPSPQTVDPDPRNTAREADEAILTPADSSPSATVDEPVLPRVDSDVTIKAVSPVSEAVTAKATDDADPPVESSNTAVGEDSPEIPAIRKHASSGQGASLNISDSTASSTNPIWLSAPASRVYSRDSPRTRSTETRSVSMSSFVTAEEEISTPQRLATVSEDDPPSIDLRQQTSNSPTQPSEPGDTTTGASSMRQSSVASLLKEHQRDGAIDDADQSKTATTQAPKAAADEADSEDVNATILRDPAKLQHAGTEPGLVHFDIAGEEAEHERHVKVRLAQMRKRDTFKRIRKSKINDGEIIKMEKMLVRVDFTTHDVPTDFTENEGEAIESRTIDKWKEFMCVCRERTSDDSPIVLQLYKSRVIPAVEKTTVKKRWKHEIQMRPSNTKVNLYSSLDKTMVIWHPTRKGTLIYSLNCRSGANSMEWYTFLRNVLGWGRSTVLQVNVPDLEVNLRLENPFEKLESVRDMALAVDGNEEALARTMREEQAAAGNVITRCMTILRQSPEWSAVIEHWEGAGHMGLAWKRYDRLEWVHGANERKMYGTIGMEKFHELELRPKEHYSTVVQNRKETLAEPTPVEGFLVRLTSQRGLNQKLGRFFFKRLYFSTHSQFLVFNRPSRADPPPPPKMPMTHEREIPSAQQIAETIPLVYSVNPFPLDDEKNISWLKSTYNTPTQCIEHDRDANDENERKLRLLLQCDGLINLCNITRVRNVHRGAVAADENLDSGSDVDFNQEVNDTHRDDGTTPDMDDKRTFELVLANGLVIRLQAYDPTTKSEWMTRLRALTKYWRLRTAADITLHKTVRQQNLARLRLDEQAESLVGQYARKWEVSGSYASPQLFHMCGISCCRTVHMAGMLYRKPRMHGVFKRNLAVLSHGKLLMFADALRGHDGSVVRHIHHARVATLDLRDCYIYSGLSTASELLYQSNGFDKSRPGRHALPRMYLEDGWSSIDEDVMTCFVLWHGKKSSWFASQGIEENGKGKRRLRKVRRLGTEGRSVVFKARSRAERDQWVLSVGMEIERAGMAGEDVRVEEVGGKS